MAESDLSQVARTLACRKNAHTRMIGKFQEATRLVHVASYRAA